MTENTLEGIYPALPTPIDENNNINYETLEEHINYLEENQVNGLVPAGCTGHAASLGDQSGELYNEHVEYVANVSEMTDLPILAGTGMNTTKQTIDLAQEVEDTADIDYHMMISPYVNCPPQDMLVEHYKQIAEEVEEPIIAYNVPGRTGRNIDANTAIQLAETNGIVGLKEASEDANQVYEIARRLESEGHEEFALLSGVDDMNHFFYDAGGSGAISVSANVAPAESVEVWEEGYLKNDRQESYELNRELQPLHDSMFQNGEKNPMSVHYALNEMGFDFGVPRMPLARDPRQDELYQNQEEIESVLEDLDILE